MLNKLRSLLRRLPLIEYLSLHLIIGLLVSVLCLWLFGNIADEVMDQEWLVQIDVALANALYTQATPTGTNLYQIISLFGAQLLLLLSVVIAVFLAVRRSWMHLLVLLITLIGGVLLNTLLKEFFARSRPAFNEPLAIETSFSFPSAHSMMSLVAYGILAYFLWLEIRSRYGRIFLVFFAVLLIALIGISRMALGVHYLSDVVGGFAAGGMWLAVCITAMGEIYRRRKMRLATRQKSTQAV